MNNRVQEDEATAREFIARINAADLDGLVALMTRDHLFQVEGEEPTAGREAMRRAWARYFAAYPTYRIDVDALHGEEGRVIIVGHTTGSHLPVEIEEIPHSVLWEAQIVKGLVAAWIIYPATPENRQRFNLP